MKKWALILVIGLALVTIGIFAYSYIDTNIVYPLKAAQKESVEDSISFCKLREDVARDVCIEKIVELKKQEYDFGSTNICEDLGSLKYRNRCFFSTYRCDKVEGSQIDVCTLTNKDCNSIKLEREFDGYRMLNFESSCPSLTTRMGDGGISLSYQGESYNLDTYLSSNISYIPGKSFEEVSREDCIASGISSSEIRSITPNGNQGVICISLANDFKMLKLGMTEQTENDVMISWTELY